MVRPTLYGVRQGNAAGQAQLCDPEGEAESVGDSTSSRQAIGASDEADMALHLQRMTLIVK